MINLDKSIEITIACLPSSTLMAYSARDKNKTIRVEEG
jgi:hypothetical protein